MSDPQQPSEPHIPAPDAAAQLGPVASEQRMVPQTGDAPQPPGGAAAAQAGSPSYGVPPQPYGVPPQQSYPGYAQPHAPGYASAPGYPPAPQGFGQPPTPGYPQAPGYAPQQQGYPSAQGYGPAPQAPGYPQSAHAPHPGYQAPDQARMPSAAGAASVVAGSPTNNPALWSMILGAISAASLLSLLIPFLGFFIVIMTFPLSICSVALGYAGLSKAKRAGGVGRTNAIIGMILGHIALLLAIAVGLFLLLALIAAMSSGSFG